MKPRSKRSHAATLAALVGLVAGCGSLTGRHDVDDELARAGPTTIRILATARTDGETDPCP